MELYTDFNFFLYGGVSKNRATPKSSILIGISLINHPFFGVPLFLETPIWSTVDLNVYHGIHGESAWGDEYRSDRGNIGSRNDRPNCSAWGGSRLAGEVPSRKLTYPQKWHFEDDFPFPKLGYVNPLPGGYVSKTSPLMISMSDALERWLKMISHELMDGLIWDLLPLFVWLCVF